MKCFLNISGTVCFFVIPYVLVLKIILKFRRIFLDLFFTRVMIKGRKR